MRSADRSTTSDASVASVTRPLPAARQRHVGLPPPQLNFATFNVRSLRHKVDATRDLLLDQRRPIDIICLTETWHEDPDDVPIRRLRADGFQVLERARPTAATKVTDTINFINHGGVAIVAPTRVKITKLTPKFELQTFELLCARISSCGASCIVAVVYRPGSDDKTEAFYGELARLLSSFVSPFFITGDLNVRFDRSSEPPTVRVNDILSSYCATQHVDVPTHRLGGSLDVVITDDDCTPTCVHVDDPGLSDHWLVRWLFNLRLSSEPVYEEHERRVWYNFNLEVFQDSLSSSCLCDTASFTGQFDVNGLADMYNSTMEKLLDVHAPRRKVTCRVRRRTDPCKWSRDR